MNEDIQKLLDLREMLIRYHEDFYSFMSKTLNKIKGEDGGYSVGEICDFGFLCRRKEVYFDELRKIARGRKELCIKIMGFFLAQQSLEDPENCIDRIDGELASARVTPKSIPKIPAKDHPDYIPFMESLGVPEELLKGGLIKADFKGVSELVTNLLKTGQDLPPGVVKTWTEYTGNFYEKKKGD
jgi:hypothetical protein